MNQIGLTTQIAKYKYENYLYLQLLDAIENKGKVPIDALHPKKIIRGYMKNNKLDFVKLVAYASKYYRKEILLWIGEIAASELQ